MLTQKNVYDRNKESQIVLVETGHEEKPDNNVEELSDWSDEFEPIPDVMANQLIGTDYITESPFLEEYRNMIKQNVFFEEPIIGKTSEAFRCKEKYRTSIVDWIISINKGFNFFEETVFLAISLFDRICRSRLIVKGHLQLYASTCLFIASKMEETSTPTLSDFIYICENAYQESEFIECERIILRTLKFDVAYHTSFTCINTINERESSEKANSPQSFVREALFLPSYGITKPCVIALASVFLSNHTWGIHQDIMALAPKGIVVNPFEVFSCAQKICSSLQNPKTKACKKSMRFPETDVDFGNNIKFEDMLAL